MSFAVGDIVQLVNSCRAAGVINFSFRGLRFSFDSAPPAAFPVDPSADLRTAEQLELDLKSEELERLRLADPLEYEKLIIERDIDV